MDFKSLLFSFQGRIGRGQFWIGTLILLAFGIVMSILISALGGSMMTNPGASPGMAAMVLYLVYVVLAIWMGLAIGVKRCHDRGQSGWWMLITLIPVIGFFWWLINLGILAGDEGDNRFGPNPEST